MRVVGIVQARMTSSRLPGKVVECVNGVPLLEYQLTRLRRAHRLDDLVVATTDAPQDDVIVSLCHRLQVPVFRGDREDVLGRYVGAAQMARAEVVVRLTADCPLIDPALVDAVVRAFHLADPPYDYYSNTLDRGFPRGMDVEVIPITALMQAEREATDPQEREHVTLYLYRRPERFRLGHYEFRLTVDTPQDFERVRQIMTDLKFQSANPSFAQMAAWQQNNFFPS